MEREGGTYSKVTEMGLLASTTLLYIICLYELTDACIFLGRFKVYASMDCSSSRPKQQQQHVRQQYWSRHVGQCVRT